MARKRFFEHYTVPLSVARIAISVCGDYERREKLIRSSPSESPTFARMSELNSVVEQALSALEPAIRKDMLNDISEGIGYHKSKCSLMMGKNTYYRRRRKLVYDIAILLNLI